MPNHEIIPAILAPSLADYEEKLASPLLQHSNWVHIDVMDGTFTTQRCVSHPAPASQLAHPFIELHLMTNEPLAHAQAWLSHPRFTRAIIHAEAECDHVQFVLEMRHYGKEIALAINPGTPVSHIENLAPHVDRILIMGVQPGASGQKFLGEPILQKIYQLHRLYPQKPLSVDGGITIKNAPDILNAGADTLCVSSAIWKARNPQKALSSLQSL